VARRRRNPRPRPRQLTTPPRASFGSITTSSPVETCSGGSPSALGHGQLLPDEPAAEAVAARGARVLAVVGGGLAEVGQQLLTLRGRQEPGDDHAPLPVHSLQLSDACSIGTGLALQNSIGQFWNAGVRQPDRTRRADRRRAGQGRCSTPSGLDGADHRLAHDALGVPGPVTPLSGQGARAVRLEPVVLDVLAQLAMLNGVDGVVDEVRKFCVWCRPSSTASLLYRAGGGDRRRRARGRSTSR
jgi:hypothetical protein